MGRKNGFTLIELLVVISIIALLMSILMPALSKAKDQAKAVVCMSNLHQMGLACKMYTGENKGKMPDLEEFDWVTPLYKYYRNIKLLRCPMAAKPYSFPSKKDDDELIGGKFVAWAKWRDYNQDGVEKVVIGSYGINTFIGENTKDESERADNFVWKTTVFKGASYVPVFTDSAEDEDTPRTVDEPPEYDGQIYEHSPKNIHEIRDRCIDRHMRNINVLFADWHVSKVTLKRLWRLRWHREWEARMRKTGGPPTTWDDPTHWMYGYPED